MYINIIPLFAILIVSEKMNIQDLIDPAVTANALILLLREYGKYNDEYSMNSENTNNKKKISIIILSLFNLFIFTISIDYLVTFNGFSIFTAAFIISYKINNFLY